MQKTIFVLELKNDSFQQEGLFCQVQAIPGDLATASKYSYELE